MSVEKMVVSGKRVSEMVDRLRARTESVVQQSASVTGQAPADLSTLVGAEKVPEAAPVPPASPPSDVEKAAMQMSFNAAVAALEEGDAVPGVLATPENRIASLLQSYLAEQAAADPKKQAPAPGDGREAKFDDKDILGWAGSFFTWWRGIIPHKWWDPPVQPQKVVNNLRIAVLGDWGTGLYGAPDCKRAIEADGRYDVLLHLGDVYYSGTPNEVKTRFLDLWPAVPGAISRACNSNHEMYTGGYGYFDHTLVHPRFQQSSSCFAMQNANWLLVGLDSAYVEHDLAHDQQVWLDRLVRAAGGRKLVLFSHHQPYSYLEKEGDKLIDKLRSFLSGGVITAWYWGHEHRCVLYDRHPHWGLYGRCIGHSGYPYFRQATRDFPVDPDRPGAGGAVWRRMPPKGAMPPHIVPGSVVLDGANPTVTGHEYEYGPNGYASLRFDGDQLYETFHLPDGTKLGDERQLV
jgi:hypothetical protein